MRRYEPRVSLTGAGRQRRRVEVRKGRTGAGCVGREQPIVWSDIQRQRLERAAGAGHLKGEEGDWE